MAIQHAAQTMLKNFGKSVCVSLGFFISTILKNFSGFIASKVCIGLAILAQYTFWLNTLFSQRSKS
jgi:hypothetical protein